MTLTKCDRQKAERSFFEVLRMVIRELELAIAKPLGAQRS